MQPVVKSYDCKSSWCWHGQFGIHYNERETLALFKSVGSPPFSFSKARISLCGISSCIFFVLYLQGLKVTSTGRFIEALLYCGRGLWAASCKTFLSQLCVSMSMRSHGLHSMLEGPTLWLNALPGQISSFEWWG